ncbi:hypothetical protein HJC23_012438 [Cyclotella cryptica]|uniref:Plastid lipid-associated protein/fibrillin conserved domain-containing protein n=1 Tax=Cyclotella cryptica TaxID=29204 RepID=A0ABD3Q237_9STRA|eukprot:CCRYP_009377-RA/>CCRYP_009377-RA protein AED:0.21 eAED:-0.37 QI:0/-1/0/1/-1/1/1/0/318
MNYHTCSESNNTGIVSLSTISADIGHFLEERGEWLLTRSHLLSQRTHPKLRGALPALSTNLGNNVSVNHSHLHCFGSLAGAYSIGSMLFNTPSTNRRSAGIGQRLASLAPLRAVESPTSFVSDVIKKFYLGNFRGDNGSSTRDDLADQLIKTCKKLGQVGSKLSQEDRASIDDIANMLSAFSERAPAKFDLQGTHSLVYSASPGGSSGAIGPFVGKVTQSFLNEEKFINRVELLNGIFKIELNAERRVLDDDRIKVTFKETAFSLFGIEVIRKEVKGQGVWRCVFAGTVNLPKEDGEVERVLVRVLKTPSTFVIVQRQ